MRATEADPSTEAAQDPSCARLTTADSRELARILADEKIGWSDAPGQYSLRFVINEPAEGQIWISFSPVLPDGSTVLLGPG